MKIAGKEILLLLVHTPLFEDLPPESGSLLAEKIHAELVNNDYFAALILSRTLDSIFSNPAGTGGCHLILSISACGKERLKLALISAFKNSFAPLDAVP